MQCSQAGIPTSDHAILGSYGLGSDDKLTRFTRLLRDFPIELTEWAQHPSLGDAEAQTMEPNS